MNELQIADGLKLNCIKVLVFSWYISQPGCKAPSSLWCRLENAEIYFRCISVPPCQLLKFGLEPAK